MTKLTPACRSDNMAANVVATAEQHKAHAKVWNPGDRVTLNRSDLPGEWEVIEIEDHHAYGRVAHVQQGGRKVRVSPGRLKTTKHPDAAKDAATPK